MEIWFKVLETDWSTCGWSLCTRQDFAFLLLIMPLTNYRFNETQLTIVDNFNILSLHHFSKCVIFNTSSGLDGKETWRSTNMRYSTHAPWFNASVFIVSPWSNVGSRIRITCVRVAYKLGSNSDLVKKIKAGKHWRTSRAHSEPFGRRTVTECRAKDVSSPAPLAQNVINSSLASSSPSKGPRWPPRPLANTPVCCRRLLICVAPLGCKCSQIKRTGGHINTRRSNCGW